MADHIRSTETDGSTGSEHPAGVEDVPDPLDRMVTVQIRMTARTALHIAADRAENDYKRHVASCHPCRTPGVICGTAKDVWDVWRAADEAASR